MAYMRGDNYIWTDESGIHFWSADGYDSWDTTEWAVDGEEKRWPNRIHASGTSVPTDVVDEFVIMRLAHLLEDGALGAVIERVTAPDCVRGRNGGHEALMRNAKRITAALKSLERSTPARSGRKSDRVESENVVGAAGDCRAEDTRLGLLKSTSMHPLFDFVEDIRTERGLEREVPYFDPCDGGIGARALFLLEAPGPKAVESGFVSQNNTDPTAKNFCEMVCRADLKRQDIVIWNITPWSLGTGDKIVAATADDIAAGLEYLKRLLSLLPKLEIIVLIGKKAQSVEAAIRKMTELPIHRTHHMSARVFNVWPERRAETEAAFRGVAEVLNTGVVRP